MLRLVLGGAGSGKTWLLLQNIRQAVQAGGECILLVPEQFSFESEKTLHRLLGPALSRQVQVLSFTRLCNHIFNLCGGLAGQYLNATSKNLLMSVALGECRDQLQLYARQTGDSGFVSLLVDTIAELKNAGITPERLEGYLPQCADARLADKLRELSAIYSAYQALVERSYLDSDDDLRRACRALEESDFAALRGKQVFLDDFTAFMSGEYEMIRRIIQYAQEVTAAFGVEELGRGEGELGLFAPVQATARRFVALARECGVPVATPICLQENHRFAAPALWYLQQQFLRPGARPFGGEPEGVRMVQARDIYSELEFVSAEICRLTREEGLHYREIAVIARDIEPYKPVVEDQFARRGIAYYVDRREDIAATPLIAAVLGALAAVRGGYDTAQILRLAKNPVLGLDAGEVALLENYCYVWSVTGASWTAPFVNHPLGLREGLSPEQQEALAQINRLREGLMGPLSRLREAARECDGEGFARAIWEYLTEIGAADHLRAYVRQLQEFPAYIELNAAVWDALVGILDVFASTLRGVRFPLARRLELLELAVQGVDIGTLPQTLDQVIVGSADRIRPAAPKVTFVLGAVEGEFPAVFGESGLLSDAERTQMAAQGLEINAPSRQRMLMEKYYAYFAVTTPSHRLYVTRPCSRLTGEPVEGSEIERQLLRLFGPQVLMQAQGSDPLFALTGEAEAFAALCAHLGEDTPFTATLMAYLQGGRYEPQLRRLLEGAERTAFRIADSALAGRLFGRELRLSPSRVERYFGCPFSYFCASGLSVQPRRRVEFSPIESGSVIHHVLERFLALHPARELQHIPAEVLRAQVGEILDDYLAGRVSEAEALPKRFRYLYTRLVETLCRLLRHLGAEFAQSAFEPVAFELPIERGGPVEPLALTLPDGGRIWVEGVVDRVDVMERDGRKYARVVDYKSGVKEFRLADIYYGLNMQMLIYLFSIWQGGREALAGALPAGVLYMPARGGVVSVDRRADDKTVADAHNRRLRMNGLLLDAPEVVSGMEREVAGVFIPARRKKDGSLDAASSVASLAQLGVLKGKVEKLLTEMGRALRRGEIAARPASGLGYDACRFCDYRAVCLREEEDEKRELAAMPAAEVLEKMREEEEADAQLDPGAAQRH